ncbi:MULTISPECIES: helix-turn-helix domain-containing protein [Kordiimonadales]|uniref:Helix-turn-helix transcriptional regulator n=1 Tax=Gimibacter soli TaxID=3024400 RepID=A0AAE9XQX9_9PROT|nr:MULTISPECIES: helix-turn-helix transcriptional regulator [Kordiimonadales]WCL54634.1 helix-turn-helix transcriptional regulator [Gimibacter soli]
MTPFGERLRELRAARGESQAEMAAALQVTPAYLSALEHGKRGAPSWPFLQKVIHHFGLIWDDAEALTKLAQVSKPRVTIDTSGMDERATRLANLLAKRLPRLTGAELDAILKIVDRGD